MLLKQQNMATEDLLHEKVKLAFLKNVKKRCRRSVNFAKHVSQPCTILLKIIGSLWDFFHVYLFLE